MTLAVSTLVAVLSLCGSGHAGRVHVNVKEALLKTDSTGKCQFSCTSLPLQGPASWHSTTTDEELHALLDSKCKFKSCRKCDGQKHGTWTPCCAAGGCSRSPTSDEQENAYQSQAQLEEDVAAFQAIAQDADADADVDVDEFKNLLLPPAAKPETDTGVAVDDQDIAPPETSATDDDDAPEYTEEESVALEDIGIAVPTQQSDSEAKPAPYMCPKVVIWNLAGWPRCRNGIVGHKMYKKFVKTACCKDEIQAELDQAAAELMCNALDNQMCKKADRKIRKKMMKGQDNAAIQGHVQTIMKEAGVSGDFPEGFKCTKMYYCDTGKVMVGPQASCHVKISTLEHPEGEIKAIGTKRNACVAESTGPK